MALIALTQVVKSYQVEAVKTTALKRISLQIHSGEMVAIVGTSGSGKSTLMNIIGLLDKADVGQYCLQGKDITHLDDDQLATLRNQTIGFVFQQFHLLPRFNALQNVALPLLYRNLSIPEANAQALTMLKRVKMDSYAQHTPRQLSGGQQQRIAIARALIGNPDVILADEPTGALDANTGQEIIQLFSELNSEGRTIIIVTHDKSVAKQCSRKVNLTDGEIKSE